MFLGPPTKPTEFIGSAREDLQDFPDPVRLVMGHAIYMAR
jgi:phage-related protein